MTSTVTVTGDTRLRATMANAQRQFADMTSANRQTGEVVRARAASNAPKRTGRLAGSVRASASRGEVVVSAAVNYAPYIEYGHQTVPARPFLSNALRDTERANVAVYERRVNQAVAQIHGA